MYNTSCFLALKSLNGWLTGRFEPAPELKSTDEKREAINIQQQVNVAQTEAQQANDKLNRANESDETTKINEK